MDAGRACVPTLPLPAEHGRHQGDGWERERENDFDSWSVSTRHDSPMALLIKRETEILSTVASERAR